MTDQKHESGTEVERSKSPHPAAGPRGLPPKVEMDVRHVILVLSGKGGVGKTTVAVNLATALSAHGYNTGLVDLDIHGPDVAKMLGIEGKRLGSIGKKIIPNRVTEKLAVMSMAFFLPDSSSPVIWRGPMKNTAIRQFLEDVEWGPLDFLVVDLPPGTGDEALSIIQLAPNVDGAVVVTTPQDVSVLDASKAVQFVKEMEIPVLGIIENMSGMTCPHCEKPIDLFGNGGGRKAAENLGVPFLGAIPLDPRLVRAGDEGRPYILQYADSAASKAIDSILESLIAKVEGSKAE